MLVHLAKKLFELDENAKFYQVPCEEDPRGFVEVYGSTPGEVFSFAGCDYTNLCAFYTHLSFSIPGRYDAIVEPGRVSIKVTFYDKQNKPGTMMSLPTDEFGPRYFKDLMYELIAPKQRSV